MEFKRGQRVTHRVHGAGTVFMDSKAELSSDEVTIDFDVKPEGWDKILNVLAKTLLND